MRTRTALRQVHLGQQHGRFGAGLGHELALRPEHEAVAPEIGCRRRQRRGFVADAFAGEHRQVVGDGMAAMAEDPGIALAGLLVLRVVRVPADRGRMAAASAPASAIRRAASGYHWSQHTSTPRRPTLVSIGVKPRSPG